MTRIISIISGKGGVGKTFLTANLAYALAELGREIVAIDANLTTPHLGLYVGMHLAPITLHDVLKGYNLKNALYPHPFGFKVMPGSLNLMDLNDVEIGKLPEIILNLVGSSDYILLDSAPGFGREAVSSLSSTQEILIVTTPELPSVIDATKVLKLAQAINKGSIGIVLNRIKNKSYELSKEEVEKIIGLPVIAEIPEDPNVPKSISRRIPLVQIYPDSPASLEIRRLAHWLEGMPFKHKPKYSFNLLEFLASWINK